MKLLYNQIAVVYRKPYPLLWRSSGIYWGFLAVAVFIALMIRVFEPYGLGMVAHPFKAAYIWGFVPVIVTGFLINQALLNGLLLRGEHGADSWTAGRELLWILWNIFSIGLLADVYFYLTPLCRVSFSDLFRYLGQGLLIAVIPETFYVMISYAVFLRRRLHAVETVNRKLDTGGYSAGEMVIELTGENEKDVLEVPLEALLFIRSVDNYCNVYLWEKGSIQRNLLRSSLKRMEGQIKTPELVRCHRSYIVNLTQVRALSGNARGYRLHLRHFVDPIPVSRENGKVVLHQLERLAG